MARYTCPRCSTVVEGDPATLRCPRCGYPDPAPMGPPTLAAPATTSTAPPGLPPPAPRPLGGLRTALMVLVPLAVLAMLLFGIATRDDLAALRSLRSSPSSADVQAILPHVLAILGYAFLLAAVALPAFIVKVVWSYRARRNVNPRQTGFTWAPGWAIGAWFIPFANTVLPYLALREAERAATAPPNSPTWHAAPASPLLPIVITLEVAGGLLGLAGGAINAVAGTAVTTQTPFLIATTLVTATAQGLFLAFVQRLTRLAGGPPAP